MKPFVSVIVPVHNAETSIASCLSAILSSDYKHLEVVVVDDCSDDGSMDIVKGFPCRLIMLPKRSGASRARNAGAFSAKGDILFFTDADCILFRDTISRAVEAFKSHGPDVLLGGTYSYMAFDPGLYSGFQSMFVSYHETRSASVPDYVATHAMVMGSETFRESGGFIENFMPILEDVEFSHRLKDRGTALVIDPAIRVRHQFDFSLAGSLRNAFRKSHYWTIYSALRGDMLSDSGTASHELKINVCAWCLSVSALTMAFMLDASLYIAGAALVQIVNMIAQRRFLRYLMPSGRRRVGLLSALYYLFVYPAPVAAGSASGLFKVLIELLRSPRAAGRSVAARSRTGSFNFRGVARPGT